MEGPQRWPNEDPTVAGPWEMAQEKTPLKDIRGMAEEKTPEDG